MLKMLWEEIVWATEDVKYWFERRIDSAAYHWRGLNMLFESAARDIKFLVEDKMDALAEQKDAVKRKWNRIEPDGSVKIGKGVYVYPPEQAEKPSEKDIQRRRFEEGRKTAIDADYTDITPQ